jgi:hypothetical protein
MPPARSCVVLRRGVLRGDTARSRGPLTAVQTEALAGQRCGMVTGTADETGPSAMNLGALARLNGGSLVAAHASAARIGSAIGRRLEEVLR